MLRGVMHVEELQEGEKQKVVIDQLPYNVNKSVLNPTDGRTRQ